MQLEFIPVLNTSTENYKIISRYIRSSAPFIFLGLHIKNAKFLNGSNVILNVEERQKYIGIKLINPLLRNFKME